MLVVVALGGNALAQRGEPIDVGTQRRNVRRAAAAVAQVAVAHQVVVTHGNGPQIGLLALQAESYREGPVMPLDVLGAESEGMVGYLVEQELGTLLQSDRVATLLTQVSVDPADPAFAAPTKPIGPVYPEAEARRLAASRGWAMGPDGNGVRRLVPSPEPVAVLELAAIRALVAGGFVVVCAGGGGIPVVPAGAGYAGVEGVVDKDLSAALLARSLGADALLLVTDVAGVYLDWGTPRARPLAALGAEGARAMLPRLPAGSMRPKVEAACRFASSGVGRRAVIGALDDAAAMLAGRAGTEITA